MSLPPPAISVEAVRAQDWEAAIKASYQPVEVASGLWIVPTWCVDGEGSDSAPWTALGAKQLILEPGLAFGTGDHPTTRLCLRWLQKLSENGALKGCSVMDYGTGSGVLAVAALLLGAQRAVGTDVEPLAVRSADQNAALNGVGGAFTALRCGADLAAPEPLEEAGMPEPDRKFSVVVANILRGPLLELAPRLAGYAAPGAALGLSGILESQAPVVIEAYTPWFEGFEMAGEAGWAVVTATRRRD
jgi:ribosomal protein L11 methyltransferase